MIALFFASFFVLGQQVDPTRPFGVTNNPAQVIKGKQLTLQSIVGQGGQKNVIISGKLLKIGDNIGEYKLQQINANTVILRSAEKSLTLSLFVDVVTKTK